MAAMKMREKSNYPPSEEVLLAGFPKEQANCLSTERPF
jgi:hypothetical protein